MLKKIIIQKLFKITMSDVICLGVDSIKSVCFSFKTSIKHLAAYSGENCVRS